MRIFAIIALCFLAGCSKQQVRPYGIGTCPVASPSAVQVLYSFPVGPHTKVGSVSVRHYQPGFGDPTVEDARERLQESGHELGAEAVVVTNSNTTGNRQIQISAEAICFREP